MGIGKENNFISNKVEYSTPLVLFNLLQKEFNFSLDVCANEDNFKCSSYFTEKEDALKQDWVGNCWMNPPFTRNLNKWVRKAQEDADKFGGTKVCLIPVRSNTKWWGEVIEKAEIRFILGEVNFNDEPRGLWLPMCILIFGEKAMVGYFSTINYRELLKNEKRNDKKIFTT
jgi:site-specific DNA-methyltransferase (adenine-specific)